MLALWFLPALQLRPVDFPMVPFPSEIRRGVDAYRAGKGLDRILFDDRVVIGRRILNVKVDETEQVVWFSPSLAARWMGYLWAKEKWHDDELMQRWNCLRILMNGRMTFIVELANYPPHKSKSLIERLTECAPFENVRVLMTFGGSRLPLDPQRDPYPGLSWVRSGGSQLPGEGRTLRTECDPIQLAQITSREPIKFDRTAWHNIVPFAEEISWPYDETGIRFPIAPLGDYSKAWYLVSIHTPSDVYGYGDFQLRVLGHGAERVANFRITNIEREKSKRR